MAALLCLSSLLCLNLFSVISDLSEISKNLQAADKTVTQEQKIHSHLVCPSSSSLLLYLQRKVNFLIASRYSMSLAFSCLITTKAAHDYRLL